MRRILPVLPALPALILPVLLCAGGVRAAEVKLGFVDMRRVVQEVAEGKQAIKDLESDTEERRKAIDTKSGALQKMKADFDKQESVLADDVKKKKQEELQRSYLELQKMAADAQEEMARKQQEVLGSMQAKVVQAAQDVAARDGIDYVITKDAFLVAPSAADLTNEVVRRYNERFKVGGGEHEHGDKKGDKSAKK
jgi:outer membrane protein